MPPFIEARHVIRALEMLRWKHESKAESTCVFTKVPKETNLCGLMNIQRGDPPPMAVIHEVIEATDGIDFEEFKEIYEQLRKS